ncbi:tRNA modification GTPase MnmE [Planctomycetales bacterium 10988]|nr:tRNA modification GTPase MnmE [Planctomycetales bacterium 10988]
MPANLTPQYHKALEAYRRATSPEEELNCLQEMLRELPKHKGTDKLQADLKAKISVLKKSASSPSTKKGPGIRIPRQGAGRVILLGGPNSGKSQLLKSLTNAEPEIADYPFTTRTVQPGMMPWKDISIQIIDTPPVTADYLEADLQNLIRGADLCLFLIDLSTDQGLEDAQAAWEKLNTGKTKLSTFTGLDEEDIGVTHIKSFAIANKMDAEEAEDRLELLHELSQWVLQEFKISANDESTLDKLKEAIFEGLNVVRVYSKMPNKKEADFEKPFTLPSENCVLDFAGLVHQDFVEKFKSAKVWTEGNHDAISVKGDHVLKDRDIVELHLG